MFVLYNFLYFRICLVGFVYLRRFQIFKLRILYEILYYDKMVVLDDVCILILSYSRLFYEFTYHNPSSIRFIRADTFLDIFDYFINWFYLLEDISIRSRTLGAITGLYRLCPFVVAFCNIPKFFITF